MNHEYLIVEPGKPPRAMHWSRDPSLDALNAIEPEWVVDPAADPDNPDWLRFRGVMDDATYDRLKAAGRVQVADHRVEVISPKKPKK